MKGDDFDVKVVGRLPEALDCNLIRSSMFSKVLDVFPQKNTRAFKLFNKHVVFESSLRPYLFELWIFVELFYNFFGSPQLHSLGFLQEMLFQLFLESERVAFKYI